MFVRVGKLGHCYVCICKYQARLIHKQGAAQIRLTGSSGATCYNIAAETYCWEIVFE